jgi:hypothetical protein
MKKKKRFFQKINSVLTRSKKAPQKLKTKVLLGDSGVPKNKFELNGIEITSFLFEGDLKTLSDPKKFAVCVLISMGSFEEQPKSHPIKLNTSDLLVGIGMARDNKEADRLLQDEVFGMGEPSTGIKKLTNELLIEDPANALITINKSNTDWAFVTFEV